MLETAIIVTLHVQVLIPFSEYIPDTQEHRKGKYHLKLYFKNMISVQRSHISYPIESLIAELGGYLGLLLGVSSMDLYNILGKVGVFFSKVSF